MEDLGLTSRFWAERRVLVTGHTGFKGAWLCCVLHELGAVVRGQGLPASTQPAMFNEANMAELIDDQTIDVRNLDEVSRSMNDFRPEIVFHLAAQALVRHSYVEPVSTFETNIMGTVNVLEAMRRCPSVRAAVMVTSDKCYSNSGLMQPLRESDPMGGDDPYSASKGCAELVVAAMRRSYFSDAAAPAIGSGRAGNVIGGGDWSDFRLIPDCARSLAAGKSVAVRNPQAIRPWQHVLDALFGYIMLAEKLTEDRNRFSRGWNFGPDLSDTKKVGDVVVQFVRLWDINAKWIAQSDNGPHEAGYLALDTLDARSLLGWRPKLDLAASLEWTVDWYRRFYEGKAARELTFEQVRRYIGMLENQP